MHPVLFFLIGAAVLLIGYFGFQWSKDVLQEGLENQNRNDITVKRNIEFLHHLITRSDPTPDNTGDYTSDVGVKMINQFIKTMTTEQRLHPDMEPYMEKLQHTEDTEENDALILELKKLIVELHDKQQERLKPVNLEEISKELRETAEEADE